MSREQVHEVLNDEETVANYQIDNILYCIALNSI